MTDYTKMSTELLLEKFDKLGNTMDSTILEKCRILRALDMRGVTHPAMKSGYLKHYRDIAAGRLSPTAIRIFGGYGAAIRHIAGMSLELQEEYARGKLLVTAELRSNGEIVSKERTILQLDPWELDIVFDNGSVRPFLAQKRMLAARPKRKHRSNKPVDVRYDHDKEEFVCGQLRISARDIFSAASPYWLVTRKQSKKSA